QPRRRVLPPISEMPVAFLLTDQVEAGAAAGNGLDVPGCNAVGVEKASHLGRIVIVAERRHIVGLPVGTEPGAGVPDGVERIAGKAHAVLPLLAAGELDHALAHADEPFGHVFYPPAECPPFDRIARNLKPLCRMPGAKGLPASPVRSYGPPASRKEK